MFNIADTVYSFSVRLTGHVAINDSPVVFQQVDLNVGDGYDQYTGNQVIFMVNKCHYTLLSPISAQALTNAPACFREILVIELVLRCFRTEIPTFFDRDRAIFVKTSNNGPIFNLKPPLETSGPALTLYVL